MFTNSCGVEHFDHVIDFSTKHLHICSTYYFKPNKNFKTFNCNHFQTFLHRVYDTLFHISQFTILHKVPCYLRPTIK